MRGQPHNWAKTFPAAAAAAAKQGGRAAIPNVTNSAFEAARAGRRLKGWAAGQVSPKNESLDYPALRRRAYDLMRNNPLAVGLANRLGSEIVGTGILPKVEARSIKTDADKALAARIDDVWRRWTADCVVGPRIDYYGWQGLAVREWIIGGDALAHMRELDTRSGVPLRLSLLSADRLSGKAAGFFQHEKNIVDGVELDDNGQAIQYWIEQVSNKNSSAWGFAETFLDPIAIPAERMAHLFTPSRAEQVRGFTRFASAMVRMHGLDLYQDGVLERQKLQNLFAAFVLRKPSNVDQGIDAFGQETKTDEDTGEERMLPSLEPGIFAEVDGDDIKFSDPSDAGANYQDFCAKQVMDICTAFGIPYQLVTFDFSKTNDRVMRVALNSFHRSLREIIHTQLVPMLLQPIRDAWFDAAILSGALPAQADAMRGTDWVPTRQPYINPLQDVRAQIEAVNAGLTSRSAIVNAGDVSIDELDQQRQQDLQRERELGLAADSGV